MESLVSCIIPVTNISLRGRKGKALKIIANRNYKEKNHLITSLN